MTSPLFLSQRSTGIAALIFCCAFRLANAEPVIGQFELKTLESTPGALEFQSQNAWSWGHPSRQARSDDTGRPVFDDNAVIRQRHALELEAGLTSRLKTRVGVELEKERIDEPDAIEQANAFDELQLTELGIEVIAILIPAQDEGASLGVVAELEHPVDQDESDKLILGPVVEFRSDRWLVAAVPTVVRTFGGDSEEDDKWDFMYAAQLAYSLSERWTLALEGYGTVERLDGNKHSSALAPPFRDFDQHRAGIVCYYEANLTVGIGLLEGINDHTPDHTLKLSIEVDF